MTAIFTGLGAGFTRGSVNILGRAGQLGSAGQGRSGEGISVNAATGNLVIERQDEWLVGRGPDAGISRIYNSIVDTADGDNGDQWQQSTTRRVFGLTGTQNAAASTIKRLSGDGTVITYTWDTAKQAYLTKEGDGAHDTLTFAAGSWTWRDGSSQATETYAAATTAGNWRISSHSDTDGNALTFSYLAGTDKLNKVTTADGGWTQYTWSGNNITQVTTGYTDLVSNTAKTLTRVRYAYDAANRLSTVITDLTPGDNVIADGKTYVTTYTYAGTSKRVASVAQTDGSSLAITYDASNRVASLTQTAVAGTDLRSTSFVYGTNFTSITAPDGQVTRMDYDASKQLTKITAPPATAGAAAQTVLFAYDANGNVTRVTDALAKATNFTYDANGNQLTSTDPNANVVTRTYGSKNELLTQTVIGSDATGATGAHTTRYAYDAENHLRYTISAEGYVTEYYYNPEGQMYWQLEYPQAAYNLTGLAATATISEASLNTWRTSFNNTQNKITYTIFDARGNATRSINYGKSTSAWGSGDGSEGYTDSYFTYDQAGRLLASNKLGQVTETFVYDGLGRLAASTDLNGGTTTVVFNDGATTTTVTTASGAITTSTYNKAGDLISQIFGSDWSPSAASTFKYDKLGRVRMMTDATGVDNYYIYDKAGRKTAEIDDVGGITEYVYDAANRIAGTITYTYGLTAAQIVTLSNPNSVVEISSLRPVVDSTDIRNWSIYDAGGRLIESIDGTGGVATFEYDKSDRLIKTTSYFNKLTQAQIDGFKVNPPTSLVVPTANAAKDNIIRSFYDRDGRMLGTLNALGYLSEVIYDKAGQKVEEVAYAAKTTSATSATDSFTALRATVAPAAAANIRTRYVYDGRGMLRYTINAQGAVSSFTYNYAGKLTATTQHYYPITTNDATYANIKATMASIGVSFYDRTSGMAYDAAGRISTSTDVSGLITTFTYDNRGQVIKTVVGSGAEARTTRNYYTQRGELRFSVDAESYVTEQNFDTEGRVLNQIRYNTKVVLNDGSSIGNVSTSVAADYASGQYAINTYYYNVTGRKYLDVDSQGNQTLYVYKSSGLLQSVYSAYGTSDQTLTVNGYDGAGQMIYQFNAYGEAEQTLTQYAYDGLGNRTSMTDANGKVTTYTYDKLGQVLTMTDAAAGVTSYEYDAFGQVVKVTDARGNASYNYYDNLGRLTLNRDAESYLTETGYTIFGDVASVTRRYTKTAAAASTSTLPATTANAKDAATSFVYDKRGLVTRSTDAEGYFQNYGYDAFGNRISSSAKSSAAIIGAGGTTTYAYDKRGQLSSETLPFGSYNNAGTLVSSVVTNTYIYDARGNRTQMIEAAGLAEARTTSYVYDKNNRLIETVGQSFLSLTPRSYYKYDARGNVTETIDPSGARTIFFYDDLNRKVTEINAMGTYSAYTYDKKGNVITTRVYGTLTGLPVKGGSKAEAPAAPSGAYRETVFTYDNLNRMLTSAVTGVNSYIFDGANYVLQSTYLTSAFQYDANGNVVKLTDANGNATFSYYDKLSRKTAQADSDRYLTTWAYDSEGNVLTETRFANQAAAQVVGVVPTAVADAVNDRTTTFIYDRNGNRTRETRSAVLVHNGAGGTSIVGAQVNYLYNGLGQVVRKTEGTNDQINYTYDAAGRLTKEQRAAFAAFDGSTVTPTVDYYYNGIGNLSRTVAAGAGDAAARVTTYAYDGDKLRYLTDATGFSHIYWYDASGRAIVDYYQRLKSDGNLDTAFNGSWTSYDLLGRVTTQNQADLTGGNWTTKGPVTGTSYNAYGEVQSVSVGGVVQGENKYDAGGRLIASNAGDGIWKFFGYDGNGNQTAAITSAGANLAGQSFAGALSFVGQSDVNATYTRYNARNLATIVTEEGRQLSAAGALQTLNTARDYNAFGEVTVETNANNAAVNYTYNTMGRLIKSESPLVSITSENGSVSSVRPTENYYYDAGGRLVASRDANGNLTKLTLLAGTGYGGGQAQVLAEAHADGGTKANGFDIHGDLRKITDEIGRISTQTFDAMGRVAQITKAGGLIDYYTYDGLGQLLKHTNNLLGIYDAETTDYDIQGRVISSRSFGGDITTTSYTWNASIAAISGVVTGGWTELTTYANGRTMTELSDVFGRTTSKTDLGGHITNYAYDAAGRMTSAATGGLATNYTYLNTGLVSGINGPSGIAAYGYNTAGNRITETLTRYGLLIKNQSATYDALGRLTSWIETGTATSPAASIAYQYDANGNIRRTTATNPVLNANGAVSSNQSSDYWFRFDSMNRLVTDKGQLSGAAGAAGTTIIRGVGVGRDFQYNLAGERAAVLSTQYIEGYIDGEGMWEPGYNETVSETYTYDTAGRLVTINVGGILRSTFTYDLMGRQTAQSDYDTNGISVVFSRSAVYNAKGQLTSDITATKRGTETSTAASTYDYGYGYNYALGNVLSVTTTNAVNGDQSRGTNTLTTNQYEYWDGAVQSRIIHDTNTEDSNFPSPTDPNHNYTSFAYNAQGQLQSAYIRDYLIRTVTFTNDELGQIIRRDEGTVTGNTGSPHEVWYRFAGRQLGYTGNNGTSDVTAAASITERTLSSPAAPGIFRNGQTAGSSYGDFTQSYDPLNSYNQGAGSGSYTVNQGDTLQSIAQAIYGDSNLWYKIAEANGLSGSASLIEGRTLTLPAGVARNTYNDSTMRPYNPQEAIGDLSPSNAKPPKKPKCGVAGLILLAIIAVAVTTLTAGAALAVATPGLSLGGGITAALGLGAAGTLAATTTLASAFGAAGGLLAGAGAAMAGSIVSQGVGVATGIQDKFSWKGVALAGIGAGIGAALGGMNAFGKLADGASQGSVQAIGNAVARGALSSALTQRVGVITGLQSKFDWAGVAAAGVGAGVGQAVGASIGGQATADKAASFSNFAASTAASAIANAATRSAINGENFGRNLIAAIPDVIAQILQRAMGSAVDGVKSKSAAKEASVSAQTQEILNEADNSNDASAAVSGSNGKSLTSLDAKAGPPKLTTQMIQNLSEAGIQYELGHDGKVYVWQLRKAGKITRALMDGESKEQAGAVRILQDYNRLSIAIKHLKQFPEGKLVIEQALDKHVAIVTFNDQNGFFYGSKNLILWNPVGALITTNKVGPKSQASSHRNFISPSMVLLHEFSHAHQFHYNNAQFKAGTDKDRSGYFNEEEFRVISGLELRAARFFGEPTRANHSAHFRKNGMFMVTVKDPTKSQKGYAGPSTN